MSHIRNYVATFTPEEIRQLHADAEEWDRAGMIGDCLLREKVRGMTDHLRLDPETAYFVMWAPKLLYEMYRMVAAIHIRELGES